MLAQRIALSAASAALAAVLLTACTWNDGVAGPTAGPAAVVDFGLLDVNPTSPRADQIPPSQRPVEYQCIPTVGDFVSPQLETVVESHFMTRGFGFATSTPAGLIPGGSGVP